MAKDRDEDSSSVAPAHGALHGNLLGRAEQDAAAAFFQHRDGDDSRARQAADAWNGRFGREGHEGSYAQHEAYRRYRERHLAELDRDYDDWCRENEQRFHRDFAEWRGSRQVVSNQPGGPEVIADDRAADALAPSAKRRRTRR